MKTTSNPVLAGAVSLPVGFVALDGDRGVCVRRSSVSGLAKVDCVIFDLDGVVIDPSKSILASHEVVLRVWGEKVRGLRACRNLVCEQDVLDLKMAGGFNDDWNTAAAVALLYSVKSEAYGLADGQELRARGPLVSEMANGSAAGGRGLTGARRWLEEHFGRDAYLAGVSRWDPKLVARIFMEVVGGQDCSQMYGFQPEYYTGRGSAEADSLLVERRLLDVPFKRAVYTGRTRGEVRAGMRILRLDGWVPDDDIICLDHGMPKPDGRPLGILTEKLKATSAAFIGDNPDDARSVQLYRQSGGRIPMFSIQVLFGSAGPAVAGAFADVGADMIAPDLRSALNGLVRLQKGAQ